MIFDHTTVFHISFIPHVLDGVNTVKAMMRPSDAPSNDKADTQIIKKNIKRPTCEGTSAVKRITQ